MKNIKDWRKREYVYAVIFAGFLWHVASTYFVDNPCADESSFDCKLHRTTKQLEETNKKLQRPGP